MSKINNTSSNYRNKIDYILIACLYCWHLWIFNASIWTEKRALYSIRVLVSCIFPKRFVYKVCRNQVNNRKYQDLLYRNLEIGQNIRIAKNLVYLTCTGYLALPMALVSGIISSLIGEDLIFHWEGGIFGIVMVLVGTVLFCFGVYKLAKSLQDSHIYLSYFKEFKKHDEKWLRKWKIYTILLYAGGLLSATLGIVLFIFVF